jgi:hypothetical protein
VRVQQKINKEIRKTAEHVNGRISEIETLKLKSSSKCFAHHFDMPRR